MPRKLTRLPTSQTSVASAFAQTFNLQGIPSRFNGFKQQVFTGRFKSQPGNPSDRTYPSDFGPALQKFLTENEQDAYSVLDDIGKALANENVGNYTAIREYFTAYAQNEYRSAVDFLSTWVGTSYTTAPASSTRSTTATSNATPTPPANPTCDCGESSCSEDSPPCCANGSCDLDGTCDTPNCD
ncbi:MAG: hypothetical protein LQ341_002176 [Variospora aurantia]|nr:MAG: hypothetical protein LQ341_002176 [Variospora aurantia]